MLRTTMLVAGVACAAGGASAESFTTVFGPGGAAGLVQPDAGVLNGFEAFTTFGADAAAGGAFAGSANAGQTLFFQVGPLYVGGAGPAAGNPLSAEGLSNLGAAVSNNRAYGVIGAGRSDIVFTAGLVERLTLQVRGTAEGAVTGTNPATNFGGVPTTLANAAGTLLVYTEQGLQASFGVSNAGYQTFVLDIGDFSGDAITRISLINEGPANSVVLLGELTASVVPAPGAAAALGLGGLVAVRRRRP